MNPVISLRDDGFEANSLNLVNGGEHAFFRVGQIGKEEIYAFGIGGYLNSNLFIPEPGSGVVVREKRVIRIADPLYFRVHQTCCIRHVEQFVLQECAPNVADENTHGFPLV